jgi:hypothetical protein
VTRRDLLKWLAPVVATNVIADMFKGESDGLKPAEAKPEEDNYRYNPYSSPPRMPR